MADSGVPADITAEAIKAAVTTILHPQDGQPVAPEIVVSAHWLAETVLAAVAPLLADHFRRQGAAEELTQVGSVGLGGVLFGMDCDPAPGWRAVYVRGRELRQAAQPSGEDT